MSASLIYHWRRRVLSTVAAGRFFHLPTYQPPSSVDVWQKVQELRPGKVTLWDHCFELPHERRGATGPAIPVSAAGGPVIHRIGIDAAEKLETYEYPGSRIPHYHPGAVVYVGGQRGGMHIHGWPPCNLKTFSS